MHVDCTPELVVIEFSSSETMSGRKFRKHRYTKISLHQMAWLQTSLLQSVQVSRIYPSDSKHFVDMCIKTSMKEVLEEWQSTTAQTNVSNAALDSQHLHAFLLKHFHDPGRDLVTLELQPRVPDFIDVINPRSLSEFALEVHKLWQVLYREVSTSVHHHPQNHTMLPLPRPFVIPGDRFREVYYWDSYWITLGLLASDHTDVALGMTHNMLTLVDLFDHVPNGSRTYYVNRSQPPLLSSMVAACYQARASKQLLEDALPRLIKEWEYWCEGTCGGKAVIVTDDSGKQHRLSRYCADWEEPRPESYREDLEIASSLQSEEAKRKLYHNLASAAESGWDFSSRWLKDGHTLSTIRTTQIIPADLNGLLHRTAAHISSFALEIGDQALSNAFKIKAEELNEAMKQLMWNNEQGCWSDLLLDADHCPALAAPQEAAKSAETLSAAHVTELSGTVGQRSHATSATVPAADCTVASPRLGEDSPSTTSQCTTDACVTAGLIITTGPSPTLAVCTGRQLSGRVYASNWVPLWCGCCQPGSAEAESAVRGLVGSGLLQPGGIMTSLYDSGQQWDAPNAWAPLQHMIVCGLRQCGVPHGEALAAELASRWIKANYLGFHATSQMHEKYNARAPGKIGGGGEYSPQVGFGWSNGVLLEFLRMYPDQNTLNA
ncbi:hypothetical protein CEUSTIGMA_g11254.t1 [Chlamydomonas eustigma]|uniref:Trehalase n=1 Tax=Chlamydomonas eustigma TaxID=1157962 RepID=A0A250XM19_9CHLO|nr:hypothetical protein CEUSTIGMA_g11254.t1 [Chlamydomonas eustigma]|eukprot:GAX83830.1 hypothetical protein CEUSTIGMA_g11254.t1 [Chlamydomonas eustigma]